MIAQLKFINDLFGEFDPKEFTPAEADCFHITLILGIGPDDTDSMDYFDINICTLKWLETKEIKPILLRNTIIVDNYDFNRILEIIKSCIDKCDGKEWDDVSIKLSRYFFWEYEGYS